MLAIQTNDQMDVPHLAAAAQAVPLLETPEKLTQPRRRKFVVPLDLQAPLEVEEKAKLTRPRRTRGGRGRAGRSKTSTVDTWKTPQKTAAGASQLSPSRTLTPQSSCAELEAPASESVFSEMSEQPEADVDPVELDFDHTRTAGPPPGLVTASHTVFDTETLQHSAGGARSRLRAQGEALLARVSAQLAMPLGSELPRSLLALSSSLETPEHSIPKPIVMRPTCILSTSPASPAAVTPTTLAASTSSPGGPPGVWLRPPTSTLVAEAACFIPASTSSLTYQCSMSVGQPTLWPEYSGRVGENWGSVMTPHAAPFVPYLDVSPSFMTSLPAGLAGVVDATSLGEVSAYKLPSASWPTTPSAVEPPTLLTSRFAASLLTAPPGL